MTSRADRLLKELSTGNKDTKIRATYELDYPDFGDKRIVDVVLHNVFDESPDLQSISLIRLLVRAKDRRAFAAALKILKEATDHDVLSSAIMGLVNFVGTAPELRPEVTFALSETAKGAHNPEIRTLAREGLIDLS